MFGRSLTVLLLAGALAGCAAATHSAGSFHGEQAKVAGAIDGLSSAASSHDTAKICAKILAPALSARLTMVGGSCPNVLGKALDTVDTFNVTVLSVSIAAGGSTAQTRVKSTSSGKDRTDTLGLVRLSTDGSWRVASLG